MSLLHTLPTIVKRPKKRLGRGYGSAKGGHTSSRGQKGQKARSKVPTWFEGGQLPLIRRTPFIKGKSRFQSLTGKSETITLDQLNQFKDKSTITLESLIKTLNLSPKTKNVKILSKGKLSKALTVKIPASKKAITAIKKAGGQVE